LFYREKINSCLGAKINPKVSTGAKSILDCISCQLHLENQGGLTWGEQIEVVLCMVTFCNFTEHGQSSVQNRKGNEYKFCFETDECYNFHTTNLHKYT
jgi:hypothetical protein